MTPATATWRIRDAAALAAGDRTALATGLRRHLTAGPLHSALVQVGARQQAYLALAGCPGCAINRCEPGCWTDLWRRIVWQAGGPTVALERVAGGLNPLGYHTLLWAWPATPDAAPLGGDLLAGWLRARLSVWWASGRTSPQVGAALALGGDTDGPPLAPRLAARGWRAQAIPAPLRRWAIDPHGPLAALRGGRWPHAPWLALPTIHTTENVP